MAGLCAGGVDHVCALFFCMCCKWTAVLAMKASSRLDDLKSSVDVIAGRDRLMQQQIQNAPSSRLSSSAFSTPRQLSARHQLSASSNGQLPSPDDAGGHRKDPKGDRQQCGCPGEPASEQRAAFWTVKSRQK